MDDALEFFKQNGYYVHHGALTAEEVATVCAGLGDDGGRWARGGSDSELLSRTTALDSLMYHPAIFPFAQRVLGPGARLSGLSYSPRPPKLDLEAPTEDRNEGDPLCLARQWHREDSGNVEGAAENEYYAPALQVFFYLDDVDELGHCTSVIPESAATKRSRENPSVPSSCQCLWYHEPALLPGIGSHGRWSRAHGLTSASSWLGGRISMCVRVLCMCSPEDAASTRAGWTKTRRWLPNKHIALA